MRLPRPTPLALLAAALFAASVARTVVAAEPRPAFSPTVYARGYGTPVVVTERFETCRPERAFRLRMENGPPGRTAVASGTVRLNSQEVLGPADFEAHGGVIERRVQLLASNVLDVRLAGEPRGAVVLSILPDEGCVTIRVTSPAPGALLSDLATLVEGEVTGPGQPGVSLTMTLALDGQTLEWPVPVEASQGRFAAWVPLEPSAVRFTARAEDAWGDTAEESVAVTVAPDPAADRPVQPDVSPTIGFAPLAVTFGGSQASDPDVEQLDVDVDGDGVPDFQLGDFAPPSHQVTHLYATEGLRVATYTIRDGSGRTAVARTPINVIAPPDLGAVWSGFREALALGDVEATLRFVAIEARERYRRALDDLRSDLATIASALSDLTPHVVTPNYATASIAHVRAGIEEAFIIMFVRDGDGVWRIASL